ncbi:MAG: nucleotidyltransferase domain-containing protein, partial [Nanoarchaeota archaeon]|nr:nucleotidyltransferase domain-containing protein [Nanoarchaeota archaeon]
YSDTDICVITDRGARKESILSNSSDKIDTSIFWDLPLYIRYKVIKEGKPLYVKNKLKMHRITVNTVLSYLDFKPLLERHFSRFLS